MRAIGYKKSYIRKIFLYESVIIILLANLFAIIISFLISGGLNVALKGSTGFEEVIKINLKTLSLAAIVTLFTGFISALYPAYRVTKLDSVKSLHYE
ncbi:FtsX-like permease family protein [Hathewaya histolytica]|uniref:Acidobacterial duplicated orphan permease n=1 Tax=Hathewaya histolytica TaxID=1498 RepID=A0A4U9QUM2_HATHI|nr:FtsX-like permease family protein [Hathewaya histolytica]VTQ82346.1 acidobacterial duplicated orphan permease [Hathewaya histolytica]